MRKHEDITRAHAAVRTLRETRAEARDLFMPRRMEEFGGRSGAFPRSKTFRWLLTHPVGRSLGSALLTGALSRLPMRRLIGNALFWRNAYR